RIEKLRIVSNGSGTTPYSAVQTGSESTLIGNTVVDNGGAGITAFSSCVATANISEGNGGDGIFVVGVVAGNYTSFNAGQGIDAGRGRRHSTGRTSQSLRPQETQTAQDVPPDDQRAGQLRPGEQHHRPRRQHDGDRRPG